MKVALRVDAGLHIGAGHVMRCLTLAAALRARGAEVLFLCRRHDGHLMDRIRDAGFTCHDLGQGVAGKQLPSRGDGAPHAAWLGTVWDADARASAAILDGQVDLLVVDHYALDAGWETALRAQAARILAIDDLADRDHDANLLLDQNFGRVPADYDGRVPAGCRLLTGSQYALLRPEFAALRDRALKRRAATDAPGHLLISLGGMDTPNHTTSVLRALAAAALPGLDYVTVVMGANAPHFDAVRAAMQRLSVPARLIRDAKNMAELMVEADIAVGAAGATSWERCCLGLPTVAIVTADNQTAAADRLLRAGALLAVLQPDEITPDVLAQALAPSPERYRQVGRAAAAVCDGGGAARVVAEIMS